jgi:hypothetical protein
MHIEAQKIYQLTCAVYLCLKGVFALSQHGSGIHAVAILAGKQICSFQEY